MPGDERYDDQKHKHFLIDQAILQGALVGCDRLMQRFAADQIHWYEGLHARYADLVRAAVEFNLLNRPYPYVQTKFGVDIELQHVHIDGRQCGVWQTTLPYNGNSEQSDTKLPSNEY